MADSDTASFELFGPSLPSEVRFAVKLLSADTVLTSSNVDHHQTSSQIVPINVLKTITQMCFDYISQRKFSRSKYGSVKQSLTAYWRESGSQIGAQLGLTSGDFDRLFAGILKLIETIGKHFRSYHYQLELDDGSTQQVEKNTGAERLQRDICRQAQISPPLYELLIEPFYTLDTITSTNVPAYPLALGPSWITSIGNRLISLRWCVDIAISDRYLDKIMEPMVVLQCEVKTGDQRQTQWITIECRLPNFHRLRFAVACALREMNAIERRIQ